MQKILLVDDDVITLQGIIAGVNWDNLQFGAVLSAYNFKDAKNFLMTQSIDIMLCDIQMPDGSGLELLEWVKKNSPDTICIFLTCYENFNYVKKALQLGSINYLLKPIPYDQLEHELYRAKKIKENNIENSLYINYGKSLVNNVIQECVDKNNKNNTTYELVEKIEKYIYNHITENISVETIASHFFINSDYLSKLWKSEKNVTMIHYIIKQKMFIAQQLLVNTELTVGDISTHIGYTNFSHFSKMFKREYGLTPKKYRKKYKNLDKKQ